MAVPLTCGKLQSLRGLGGSAPVARVVAVRSLVRPAAELVIMFLACAAGSGATAQAGGGAPRDVLLSSILEHIGAAPSGDAAGSVTIPADTAAPQEAQLIVSVRFTNTSDHVVDSLRITSKVPADLRYVPNSASGPGSDALFSVDDGRSFGRPEELTLSTPDGGVRGAGAADYTHVRWVLRAPLDAGASGVARFRAVPR
jgi:hypothetical protein